jgi:Flp pilus assembly protein TadD
MSTRETLSATQTAEGVLGIVASYAAVAMPAKDFVEAEALYCSGMQMLRQDERVYEAVTVFERAWRTRPLEARYASYYGLSLALSGGRLRDAEALCEHAVKLDSSRSDLFCNLGRVRLLRKDRRGAYGAFKRGLSVDRNDRFIRHEMSKMGERRSPVLPFLPRRHPLNKVLGLVVRQIRKARARSK